MASALLLSSIVPTYLILCTPLLLMPVTLILCVSQDMPRIMLLVIYRKPEFRSKPFVIINALLTTDHYSLQPLKHLATPWYQKVVLIKYSLNALVNE